MSCIENVIYKTWVNDVIMLIFLTSSTCHPKIIRKQWSDTLMPFH